jgi:hypothetical protein
MTASISIDETDIYTAIRTFILTVVACPVIKGLQNRVPIPNTPFVSMTILSHSRLATNETAYVDPIETIGTKNSKASTQFKIQLDCYGPESGEWAGMISTLLRDEVGTIGLGDNIQPISADDPVMLPLISGEQQYEQRWAVTALFQANPITTTPMQFFDEANVETISAVENFS